MKATLRKLLIGIAGCAFALQTNATIIVSLQPASQSANVGDSVSLDLVISGLGANSAPALGAFSFNLSYDPAVLSASSVTFGSLLDLGNLGSLKFSDSSTPGSVQMDEVSLESSADLLAAQPASFTLATLGFSGIAPGIGTVGFSTGSLSDETGQSLQFDTTPAEVTVSGRAAVPDPGSTWLLLSLGLGSLCALRRKALHPA